MYKLSQNIFVFLYFILWALLVLFLMSPDSPMHGPYNHGDSASFFLCGKALMNGLVPYVAFSDSKGLLLFLLYGLGYVISPTNYYGVYIIGSLSYGFIFYYNYKTTMLFLHNKMASLFVTSLMAFAYFGFDYHIEFRSEDFATLFVAVSLYELFATYYNKEESDNSSLRALVLGGCFVALLLIKYNMAVMHSVILFLFLWYQVYEKKHFVEPLLWMILGGVVFALPFILFLLLTDSFIPFIHEYFLATASTVPSITGGLEGMTKSIVYKVLFLKNELLIYILLGSILLGAQISRYKCVPMLVGLWFFILSSFHNDSWGHYYYGISSIFVLYFFISLFLIIKPVIRKRYFAILLLYIILWGIGENMYGRMKDFVIWKDTPEKMHYDRISSLMSKKRNPLVLYCYLHEYGFGLEVEPLPAGKYYGFQSGSSPQMEKEHLQLFYSSRADFVIVDKKELNKKIKKEELERLGYHQYYECPYMGNELVVWGK